MGPERNFHRVVLGYVNQVFQQVSYPLPFPLLWRFLTHYCQISGINLITYYAPTIYAQYSKQLFIALFVQSRNNIIGSCNMKSRNILFT